MANETRLRQNFLGGVLDNSPLSVTGTVMSSPGLGAAVAVTVTGHLPVILDPDGVYGEPEIVYVIDHAATSNTATIQRGREGTVAREHKKDTPWVHGPTKLDWETLTAVTVGGYQRSQVLKTTASLPANTSELTTIQMTSGYRLYAIATTVPARVRLYTTTALRDADTTRERGVDPLSSAGVMLDYATETGKLSATLSPVVDGYDGKATPDGLIPMTVTNLHTAASTVGVTLTYVRTE